MAIIVKKYNDKETVRAYNTKEIMIINMDISPTDKNNGKVEMIFLSGCDALTLGQPSVKYIWKA
jgi:hypothetical protein